MGKQGWEQVPEQRTWWRQYLQVALQALGSPSQAPPTSTRTLRWEVTGLEEQDGHFFCPLLLDQ